MNRISKAQNQREAGNALVYVLIAIALFAALSLTLGRQTDTGETSVLDESQQEFLASRLISYAAQVESGINQMTFGGTRVDNLDFTRPGEVGFDAGAVSGNINKVYHPQGGGLSAAELPEDTAATTASVVDPGWYLGRFNNVDWTETAADDVILVAYNVTEGVCSKIDEKITGSAVIPSVNPPVNLFNILIDPAIHSAGGASDFTAAMCAACDGYMSLCVERGGIYGFYTVVVPR